MVQAIALVDVVSGHAFWSLTTIDPKSGDVPEDPLAGFLPPNNTSTRSGEGFLSYTIRPRSDSNTGDIIDAEARIVFDTEEPIDTPPIFNTIDAVSPTSVVRPLPATDQGGEFTVAWAGTDDPDGSALADFIIYVSDNDGPFVPWLEDTTLTEGTYRGLKGHVYRFYSRARDNAGNGEAAPVTLEQPPAPTLSIADVSVAEGAGNAVLTITLSPTSTATTTVDYATSDGDATPGQDYQATSSSATIPAAATSTSIAVRIIDDTEDEPDETFVVTLSGPTGGAEVSSSDGAATVTIVDDDAAAVSPVLSIADVSVAEGAGNAVLTITLSPASTASVTVDYATSGGDATPGQDYQATSSLATIPAAATSTTIAVRIIDDTEDEPDETFVVTLSGPTGGAEVSSSDGAATVTILDDDVTPVVHTLSIADVSVAEGAGNAVLTITLDPPFTSTAVTVAYTTADDSATAGQDYRFASSTASIPAEFYLHHNHRPHYQRHRR